MRDPIVTGVGPPSRQVAKVICVALALGATGMVLWPMFARGSLDYRRQPSPDAFEYADAALQLVRGNGYVTYHHGGEPRPPRYPPGYSIALAPFAALGPFPQSVQFGAQLYTAFYVVAAVGVAWVIGGPLAAAMTATLIGLSPWSYGQARLIMSDAFAAGLTIILVGLLHRPAPGRIPLVGLLAGALVTVRIGALVTLVAALAASPRASWRRLLLLALPSILALGLYHWLTFGSPVRSGYDYWLPEVRTFDLSYPFTPPAQGDPPGGVIGEPVSGLLGWACGCPVDSTRATLPNLLYYPTVVLGLFWVFSPPLSTLPGVAYVWCHRREPAAGFALWLTLGSLAFYCFYWYQGSRFVAAPATALAIYSTVWAARCLGCAARRIRLADLTDEKDVLATDVAVGSEGIVQVAARGRPAERPP